MEKQLSEYIDNQIKQLEGSKNNLIAQINMVNGRIAELENIKSNNYKKALEAMKNEKKG